MTRLQYERCWSVTVVNGLVWTEGLICASFGITRLICASFEITRLIGVRVQRGADRREARRMREGHMDASGFLYASADVFLLLSIFTVRSSHDRVFGPVTTTRHVYDVAAHQVIAGAMNGISGIGKMFAVLQINFTQESTRFQGVDDNNRETLSLELSKSVGLGGE
ncbi:hypothetical protein E6C27_scaffold17G001530 [Cucumis melo var. makuwa]|uniref:Uncharacterized protein n=1 Tax=Cucumis melo var. makuwa TaxID=1194695 RepID=A0A5A7VBA9_CUCMM|nr:hypothetical protein E6C27_scaffold17G001530 [Cucumis melo var. makuwa]